MSTPRLGKRQKELLTAMAKNSEWSIMSHLDHGNLSWCLRVLNPLLERGLATCVLRSDVGDLQRSDDHVCHDIYRVTPAGYKLLDASIWREGCATTYTPVGSYIVHRPSRPSAEDPFPTLSDDARRKGRLFRRRSKS